MASLRRRRTKEQPPNWDYPTLARRFAFRRKCFDWTIDELSRRSGVSRHTIMRIESGEPCRYSTIRRLRGVLRMFSDQLTQNEGVGESVSIHKGSQGRWLVGRARDNRGRPVYSADFLYVDDPKERYRQASLGYQDFYTCILRSELVEGILGEALMEIYRETPYDQHPGEEFIYCLNGPIDMTVGDDVYRLERGDSICFDASIKHRYTPADQEGAVKNPVVILVVVGIRPNEAAKVKDWEKPKLDWGV